MRLGFYAGTKPSPEYLDRLKVAARSVFPRGVTLYPATPRNADLVLDPTDSDQEMREMFEYAASLVPWPGHDHETLYFDIESHNVEKRWYMPVETFTRTVQWAWGIDGETHFSRDVNDLYREIRKAYGLVAHNGHSFDYSVILGDEALEWARNGRLFDTMVFGNIANPAPFVFKDRNGVLHYMEMAGQSKVVPHTMKWLSLDNQAFQLGVPGKLGNLKELAQKYNPPKTKQEDLDYGLIPVDDEDFVAYAKQDIPALQGITFALLKLKTPDEYDWREQLCSAINSQITRNGWVVDIEAAQKRVDEQEAIKDRILTHLSEAYGFPTEGLAPWSSAAGKRAILAALSDFGIHPLDYPDTWPYGKTGPSLAGKVLLEHCTEGEAKEFAESIAMLGGQRPLAGQALQYVTPDGRVHPDITSLQRSGRMSVTKPSLGTWTARAIKNSDGSVRVDNSVEKRYFLADPGCVLVEFDMSNADARCVAAMSGDLDFAARFEDGVDAHELTGRYIFGDELYDTDPEDFRQKSKQAAHGYNFGLGAKRLAKQLRIELEHAYAFIKFMQSHYPKLIRWQDRVREEAKVGYVINRWGRKMKVDEDRAYTQSVAMLGQSSTRELLFDALIKLPNEVLRMLKATVHDAVIFAFPEGRVDELSKLVVESFEVEWNGIKFPLNRGPEAPDWYSAGH